MVRLIGENGELVGVVPIAQALEMAKAAELDLVEVAAKADPPVCRVMDYGKFQYQQKKKDRMSAKSQRKGQLKEVKFRCKIDENDIQTKTKRIEKFIKEGDKVKIQVDFRGREIVHKDVGFALINRVIAMCDDFAQTERDPKSEGRSIITYLVPRKGPKKPAKPVSKPAAAAPAAPSPAPAAASPAPAAAVAAAPEAPAQVEAPQAASPTPAQG